MNKSFCHSISIMSLCYTKVLVTVVYYLLMNYSATQDVKSSRITYME